MYRISDYLNIIGNYTCETTNGKSSLLGTLVKKEQETNCYILQARIPISDIHIFEVNSLDLYGMVNNMEISLLNCQVKSMSCIVESEYMNSIIELDKIVIGEHYKGTACIQCVSAEFHALKYFFLHFLPYPFTRNFKKEYLASNPPITADTQYGRISLQSSLAFESTYHQLNINSIPSVYYSFNAPKTVDSAISHLASLRNLFTFLADGYIEFCVVEYSTNSSTIPNPSGDAMTVFLNQPNVIAEVKEPFLVTQSGVESDFQKIVNKWLDFYQNSIYIPTLFYEIITDRSKGINEFLNLAQAIEIYSSYFRNDEAKLVCNNDPDAEIKDMPSLKHRLTDIFSYLQAILNITDDQRDSLARIISKNRNFYTHYSSKGKEPSFITVSRMIVLLRFVVLALVYKHIGVNDQSIQSCKSKNIYTAIDESINIILLNEHRSNIVLD